MDVKYVLVSDFEKVCRICMKFDKTFLSINSFQIIDMIIACASVQIWENDDLPNQICDGCFLQLQNTINFKQLCENSDVAFRQIIEQSKNKIWNNQNELDNVKKEDAESLNFPVYVKEENDDENVINLSKDDTKKSKPDNIEEKSEIKNESKSELNKTRTRKKIIQYQFDEESNGFDDVKDENDADYDSESESEKPNSGEQSHVNNYKYNCETCTKSFKKVDALGWHMKNIHNAEGLQCGSCSLIFYHSLHLNAHEKSHNQCSICNLSFLTRRKLNTHILTHKNTLKCDSCEEKFRKQRDLKKHMRKMHPKMKQPRKRSQYEKQDVSCELCGKIVRRRNLSKHMLSHRERNNLNCRYCEKAFLSPEALKEHMEVAHKKCVCDHCGLRLRPNQLKTHLLTHTKERPHACDRCDKTYSQKCQLKQHISRIHLNERKFVCTFCSQAFFDKKCLLNHVRRHTGEKPFKCQMCEKRFIQKVALDVHMKTHTNSI
ncbi:zinc finger protein 91-like [Chrysoperla carnea]|uniref:zinc finger protein 91-like n=1 Tax=Chrysoperla carnea TaxID=189513 RepID=UPI001D060667|nr:zinc finger protein 91-like [Chrysoperla carnea]